MEKKQYQQPRMDVYRMMVKESLLDLSKPLNTVNSPGTGITLSKTGGTGTGVSAPRTKERGSIIWGDEDF